MVHSIGFLNEISRTLGWMESFNKVYESSDSTFVIRIISDRIKGKTSEILLTQLCSNQRMDARLPFLGVS